MNKRTDTLKNSKIRTKKNPSQSGVMRTKKELEELRREAYEIIEYYIKKYDLNVKVI